MDAVIWMESEKFCLAMAVPTGPAPMPLLIIVKNTGRGGGTSIVKW